MNERVTGLRTESLTAKPTLSIERASLLTEAYRLYQHEHSQPILRARVFQYLLEHKQICINPNELIVGERGPEPKATPTYPELCCHTLDDLEVIHSREKVSFEVDHQVRLVQQQQIIPFWQQRSMRSQIIDAMSDTWHECYQAGIFTEFMEQRAPGHTVADDKIFRHGFLDFKREIHDRLAKLAIRHDQASVAQKEQLQAMDICADAIILFASRHAKTARALAQQERDASRRGELNYIADVCEYVPANAPRNFHEALQAYWFIHLGVITELNTWDSFNPGRLDQHLSPFYEQGILDGTLTRDRAKELLACFWIKFNNQPAPPKVGITLKESGTYTDFANINLGGLTVDGQDGVNEVSYLLLEVIDEMKLTQPSSNIQLSKQSPTRFLHQACKVIRNGRGQPAIFNADAVVVELLRQGKTIEDARCGGTSGCVETGAFGKESYILTGYFNLVKILEITLNNGIDPKTSTQLGLVTGDPATFGSFEQLVTAFGQQLQHFIEIKIRGNHKIEQLYATNMPSPFLSIIIDDCIAKGIDYNAGGARYNTSYIQGVGIGSLTDSLAAIKYLVYDTKHISIRDLLTVLNDDFVGHEQLRQFALNKVPKYGNDDPYADRLMVRAFNLFFDAVDGRPNQKGGVYRINMLPTTCHVYFGSVIGATPDGRRAGYTLSEGISPVQGADKNGPTSVIKSAAKMDQLRTGGTLLNQKIQPTLLETDQGIACMADLVRTYFCLDGHHIQFNVVDANMLKSAQNQPDQYTDLIVRVAGYSDYFNHLGRELQDEIIARTEHRSF